MGAGVLSAYWKTNKTENTPEPRKKDKWNYTKLKKSGKSNKYWLGGRGESPRGHEQIETVHKENGFEQTFICMVAPLGGQRILCHVHGLVFLFFYFPVVEIK